MPPGARAICLRCDAVLRHTRRDPLLLPLALNVSALILFLLGATLTLMSVTTAGRERVAELVSGPAELEQYGLWEISLVVLITTVVTPLARILSMLTVLLGLRLKRPPAELRTIYAWVERLRPWSMVEIYLLGLFVAYVRLSGMAIVDLGPADLRAGRADGDHGPGRLHTGRSGGVGGDGAAQPPSAAYPRCQPGHGRPSGAPRAPLAHRLRHLRPGQPSRLRACGAHAADFACTTASQVRSSAPGRSRSPPLVLYIPANIYPVLTVVQLGAGEPSTILGGVRELLELGMWPLAALVFFASIAVPVLKLIGLGILLISTHTGIGMGAA